MREGSTSNVFGRLAAFAVRRPWPVLGLVVALAVAGTIAALRLPTDAGTDTLVDSDDPTFEATERFKEKFGDDAVVVLAKGDLRSLVLSANLGHLLELEGCLSGRAPEQSLAALPEPCREIAEADPSQVVFGPATFLNQAVVQIETVLQQQIKYVTQAAAQASERARQLATEQGTDPDEAAEGAARAVQEAFQADLIKIAQEYGLTGQPRIDDPNFVSKVVFDPNSGGDPKPRFSYLFPNANSALISIRMRPGLSESERDHAIELYRDAVNDPRFELENAEYVVSGVPAVVAGLSDSLKSEILLLLAAAVIVMAVVLMLVLAPPLRLLPLGVALAAAGLCFGALSVTGGALTMASIAVLPVLIGLAVDYAIQFQARWSEARADGAPPAEAAAIAGGTGGSVIATAVLATAAGFAVLVLSPVPMVRSFGLLLIVGIALAFLIALTAGLAALGLATRPRTAGPAMPAPLRRLGDRAELVRARTGGTLRDVGNGALAVAIGSPRRVLAAALALALCGWIAGTQTKVVSDIRELAPTSLPALRDVTDLQDQTGVSGELNVMVRSDDLASPEVIDWMRSFQQRVLERHGFEGRTRCNDADLCPAISLPDLFGSTAGSQTAKQARQLLKAIPPYFSQAVISPDPTGDGIGDTANIAFGIPVQPLDQQQELIEDIREQIDPPGASGPPEGTEVEIAGLPALAAEANADLSASRYWLPLLALVAVGLILSLAYRSLGRALTPLVPIVLATGWSALVVAAMDIPLNPMSATLGALVIAIATEFSVILSARYEAERRQGLSVGEALRRTYERTGSAVLASGLTAIAGFVALATSDIQMLRDFGLVTIADLAVALAGVMLVLPAVLVWAEEAREAPAGAGRLGRLLAPAASSDA